MRGKRFASGWWSIGGCAVVLLLVSCVSLKAPEEINVNTDRPGRRPIDTSRLPPTQDHAEARQRLAEAHERIRYLEAKVRDLKGDKEELKRERDEYKDRYKRLEDRYDD